MPDSPANSTRLTYKDAGVDVEAGQQIVESVRVIAQSASRPEVLSGIGGFAGLCELPKGYTQPVLVTATDGVGTKLKLAAACNLHSGLGQDLVAMSVNDVLVTGASPLLFLDYVSAGQLDRRTITSIVEGIAEACAFSGCALVGGETAEMPGLYQPGDYDLAGFCLGVVEKSQIIHGQDIAAGDRLIGLPSTGPHANGFSLIRMILQRKGIDLAQDSKLAAQLLAPTAIYSRNIENLMQHVSILGMAHITGGGLTENLPRMLASKDLGMTVSLENWSLPTIFRWLQEQGRLTDEEMLKTFNCGIGMVICISPKEVNKAQDLLQKCGVQAPVIGQIGTSNPGRVLFSGRWS